MDKQIILCTMGTRGDVSPFLALCTELVGRGFDTTLMTNENWEADVLATGAKFFAIAPKDPSQSGRDDNAFFVRSTVPSFRKSFDYIRGRFGQSRNLLLAYRSNMLGVESAAEAMGITHVKIALQPSAVKSLLRPPWPLTSLATGRFGPWARRFIIPVLYVLVELMRGHYRHRNRFRTSVGLPAHPLGRMGARTEAATLVFVPKWFARPPEDWPGNARCVGFPFYDAGEPERDVAAFIKTHGSPIVFTPGTGVADVGRFFEKAFGLCQAVGMPGLFLSSRPVTLPAGAVPVLKRDFADLAAVLPDARLIVHHGGIGTTAQALRAGIPQIIIPDRFDQPDNAVRIATLGFGAAVLKDDQTVEEWAELVRRLTGDQMMRQRLKKASAAIAREQAIEGVCDYLEALAGVSDAREERI